ncbi:MAG TPA: cysteine synthase family protein [Candidatus Thermoplasmatota archaeon]|nr:cysteine synthase family protein [Candidatus Thermoplasmatota archaeon]
MSLTHSDETERTLLAAPDVLALVGATPLVRLHRVVPEGAARVWAKCEFLNPGGSAKDRIGLALLEAAEASGKLRPGGTVVEASSGNTAVALAQACAVRGYRLVITLPAKMSEEKRRLVKAYGAELIVTPNAEPGSRDHYIEVAKRVARERGGVYLDQFGNPANARAHELTTGPEIVRALGGRVDAVVAGAGTGGTLTGVARAVKRANPNALIVCNDPEGSVISGGEAAAYKVEGIGDDFIPKGLDQNLIDRYEVVSDRESFVWARRLAREEGLLVGGSSGSAVAAAVRVAKGLPADANVVAILADTGRNYLSKFHNDIWLKENGFADLVEEPLAAPVRVLVKEAA